MFHGRNNGKKLMAVRIVRHTFEIIHLLTGEVRDEEECDRKFGFLSSVILESTSSTRQCYHQ